MMSETQISKKIEQTTQWFDIFLILFDRIPIVRKRIESEDI